MLTVQSLKLNVRGVCEVCEAWFSHRRIHGAEYMYYIVLCVRCFDEAPYA